MPLLVCIRWGDAGLLWKAENREASKLFSFGHSGAYDPEDDRVYLPANEVQIVDCEDLDIVHTDMEPSYANTEFAVRKILTVVLARKPRVLGCGTQI